MYACTKERFLDDVKNHTLKIRQDLSLLKHLVLNDGTSNCAYEIVSTQNTLMITGDCGTYVFRHGLSIWNIIDEEDMVNIEPDYWQTKCLSESIAENGVKLFSVEKFHNAVRKWVTEDFNAEEAAERLELVSSILSADNEFECCEALVHFEHPQIDFTDFWEQDFTEYTYHFIWCCYAIVHAIRIYCKTIQGNFQMKTIELTDEAYDELMALAAELQLQENDSQAHPVIWTPSSLKKIVVAEGCGQEYLIDDEGHEYLPVELKYEEHCEDDANTYWECYLQSNYDVEEYEHISYDDQEYDFTEWLVDNYGFRKICLEEQRICEDNPSVFKSDVKNFCETNQHHLGKDPRTFAHTSWRMPKMTRLVELVAGLNRQPKENIKGDIGSRLWKKI